MKISYEWIERHTEKASLFIRDNFSAWLPKSCYTILSDTELDVKEGFEVKWKDDTGAVVLTEGVSDYNSGGSGGRNIVVTDVNRDELWEYI